MARDTGGAAPAGRARRRRRCGALRALAGILCAGLAAACSDDGTDDLRRFVEEAKLQKGRVEPLPEFKPAETYQYTADTLKDPFATWRSEAKNTAAQPRTVTGPQPDIDRRRELLENFPLDTMRMMGTFEYQSAKWGLVKAPDGIVYKVKVGNYLGQNYGRITEVRDNKLVLTEIVPNGLGGWEERQASLVISEE